MNCILTMNSANAMRVCALQHMGIVKLHDYMVTNDLAKRKLIEIFKEYQEPEFPVYLYYQQSKLLPKIRKFVDFFMSPWSRITFKKFNKKTPPSFAQTLLDTPNKEYGHNF